MPYPPHLPRHSQHFRLIMHVGDHRTTKGILARDTLPSTEQIAKCDPMRTTHGDASPSSRKEESWNGRAP